MRTQKINVMYSLLGLLDDNIGSLLSCSLVD